MGARQGGPHRRIRRVFAPLLLCRCLKKRTEGTRSTAKTPHWGGVFESRRDLAIRLHPTQHTSCPPRRTRMNALFAPGAKRNRIIVACGLSLLLASPAVMLWASKTQRNDFGEDAYELRHAQDEARRLSTIALPEAALPPAEFSPFGGALQPRRLNGPAAVETLAS